MIESFQALQHGHGVMDGIRPSGG